MQTDTIQELLGEFADTHELVLRSATPGDPLLAAWRIAAADARDAYADWCAFPGRLTYATFLALSDQADAAAVTLAADRGVLAAPAEPHAPRPLAA
jgi:hypothetical protein